MGITGTPGFFVNGRYLRGAKPFEEFAEVINEELKKKGIPIPAEAETG
jgi:protein-disulfide isomerase